MKILAIEPFNSNMCSDKDTQEIDFIEGSYPFI